MESCKINIIKNIATLLYKENPSLVEKLDFDNEHVFLEPLLFAYFNTKKDKLFSQNVLYELMQGFCAVKEPLYLNQMFNKVGVAYIPNLGYFDTKGNKIDEISIIENTSIELILYPIKILNNIFMGFKEDVIDESLIEVSNALSLNHKAPLTNAFNYIKSSIPKHYDLIEQHCRKILLFKTDPRNTNSFATINAHGIAFLNVYQQDYDEVFFVDDIAHQTGHIILTSILFQRKIYFIIDENLNIASITQNINEYRSFYILIHALYTYYTTLKCLDACIECNNFNNKQIHEAKGRIGFYLKKYKSDLLNLEKVISHFGQINHVFTQEGISLIQAISNAFVEFSSKYASIVRQYDYSNQPYNFTFSEFSKQNPTENE